MAAVTAAVIGAVGALGGGAFSYFGSKPKKGKTKLKKFNPLYNAQLVEALIGLGVPVPEDVLLAASPLGQTRIKNRTRFNSVSELIQQGIAEGLSDADIAKQLAAFDANKKGANFLITKKGETRKRVGYANLEALVRDQREFLGSTFADQSEVKRLQEETLAGRRAAQSAIARLQGDFVAPSGEEIESRRSEIENILRAQIEREYGTQREQSLYEANAYGINPAGRLKYLDESQALANLGAGPDALARTLQLISGEQGVQASALGALQSSLGVGTTNAANLLGLQLNANNAAATQALGLAQLQSQRAQGLGNGITSATGQLGLIPLINQEQNRRRQLDELINRTYGITTSPDEGG